MRDQRFPAYALTVSILLAFALVAAGCGDDADTGVDATTTTTTVVASTAPPTTAPTTTTTALDPMPIPDDELPGEDFELSPAAGSSLAVVGVAFDDTLNVRRGPGVDHDVVAELDPTENDVTASGRARLLTESIWWEVTAPDGTLGWVNSRFTAQPGSTDDATAQVISLLGETPTAATMEGLGELVAGALEGDGDIPSSVTLTVPASLGDLGEVTYDLIGLGDDSVHGLRLHVFGTPGDSGGFSLKSVESTALCDSVRGVGASGLCT